MKWYDILINIGASIQVIVNDLCTLALQPLYFIVQTIIDVASVWDGTDDEEQPKEEPKRIGFNH